MIRSIALLLTLLTGFSGLVYEVTWQRYLATLLGSHGEATAAVLGIFLGGLSVGYRVFGRVTARLVHRAEVSGRPPRLLPLYGCIEAAIGLYALAFPAVFIAAQALSLGLPTGSAGLAFAFDIALTALLIGPPTVLMGGTIPVLTQALAHDLTDATRVHAFVYAFNTAGAFFGALAAGFFLIPWLGLSGVMIAMGAVNLTAGASFVALGLGRRPAAAGGATAPPESAPKELAVYSVVAVLAGFAMMAIQTTLNRLGAFGMGASQFTFSTVVAVFVLCIALGSFAVSALPRVRTWHLVGSQWLLVALLYLLYRPLGEVTYWGHLLRIGFRDHEVAFYPYHLAAFVSLLAIFALPIGLSGALLPLIFHHLRRTAGDLGSVAGRLYGWNTVGSLLGALLGGYALLFFLDLHEVYRLSVAAVAVGAALLTIQLVPRARTVTLALILAPVLGALILAPAWNPHYLSTGLFRLRQPRPESALGPRRFYASYLERSRSLFYADGPAASIAVNEVAGPGGKLRQRSIISNAKSDSSTVTDYPTTALIGLLPALFADACRDAFVIGYGTGVTASELAALDCTREVVVAEIARGVIDAAPLFDDSNMAASRNPEIRLVHGDAYRTLLRSEQRFDVIASEPSNPWVAGIEALYSREFLEAARARLNPGGVYAQWFHAYEMDEATLSLVLHTFGTVFENTSLWFTLGPDLLILGFERREGALDLERLLQRASQPDFKAGLARARIREPAILLAHEVLPIGVIQRAPLGDDVHTLLNPILANKAARAFFVGGRATVPFTATEAASREGRRNSLLRRYAGARGGKIGATQLRAIAKEVCGRGREECTALLAWWRYRIPDAPDYEALLQQAIRDKRQTVPITRELVEGLTALYGPGLRGKVTPARARQATERFARFYHHAFPFERAALARTWDRCRDETPQNVRCAEGRRRAQERLGALSN